MTIEITEKGSGAFYKEIVNVLAQYRLILKNHNHKLKDYFKQLKVLIAAGTIMLVLLGAMMIFWGAKSLDIVAEICLAIAVIMSAAYLMNLNKVLKSLLDDVRTSVLTIDEDGVELRKEDSQTVKLAWNNIAVVKKYKESLNFVSANQSGFIISVDKRYSGDIENWIRENRPETEVC